MAWQDFEGESTENLIQYISWINEPDYQSTGRDAFRTFCFRFDHDLRAKCRIICRNRGIDDATADEIAQKTFERFLKYPKYKPEKCKSGDTDQCVRLYLYRFAQRILSDQLCAINRPSPFTGDEDIVWDFHEPDIEAMEIPNERKTILKKQYELVKNALDRLRPKHRIIYLTYKQYEEAINAGHYLPRSLLKRMQDELELTQASIRVYKNEAFEEVDTYLKLYGTK